MRQTRAFGDVEYSLKEVKTSWKEITFGEEDMVE